MGWAIEPSKVATEVLARHAHDHNRRHLSVTVLEARGLVPRRGVVMALSTQELPEAVVTLDLPHIGTYATEVGPAVGPCGQRCHAAQRRAPCTCFCRLHGPTPT